MAKARIVSNEDGTRNITMFLNGQLLVTDNSNPRFADIVERVLSDDLEGIAELFEPEEAIRSIFAQLTSDVQINDGIVEFRGQPVNEALSNHIVRLWDAGEEFQPVVRFLEKLQNNPNPDSVERLWSWISDRHLQLTTTGNIIGYKGLRRDGTSKKSGFGDIRNGVPLPDRSHVLHEEGDVIEKSREKVVFDVNIGCAEGLHVGDFSYANSWGEVVMAVEVDPADVVSVPNDDSRKMRVCRYKVRERVKEESKDFYKDSDWENVDGEDFETEEDSSYDYVGSSDVTSVSPASTYIIHNHFDGGLVGDPDRQAKRVLDVLRERDSRIKNLTVNVSNKPVDTKLNHLKQRRDKNGRFLPKGK